MLQSLLPSIFALGLAALAALILALRDRSPPANVAQRSAAAGALALAVGVQSIHFIEELVTGFHEKFGPLFGFPPMSMSVFVTFNLTWIGIWIVSISGLRSGWTIALFAAWFLAIAGMINGIAHPVMSIVFGGYFPGLVSSPFIAIACVRLWIRLREATR